MTKPSTSTIEAGPRPAERSNDAADEKPSELISGLILFAEDDAINQLVLQQQLSKFGHIADIACDGEEAFDMFQRGDYKLLLADCHMPAMDGFELTQVIRDHEKDSGERLPIIAITGDTNLGEAERCLEAGMDGYLPKPVALEELGSVLEKWLNDPSSARDTPCAANVEPLDGCRGASMHDDLAATVPIDLALLAQILGSDDQEYLKSIAVIFWDSVRDTDTELESLFNARDAQNLRKAAHAAKGATSSVGATQVTTLLKDLQYAAADADWGRIGILMPKLISAFAELGQFIRKYSS